MLTEVMDDLVQAKWGLMWMEREVAFLLKECAIAEVSGSIHIGWFNINGLSTDAIRASKKLVQIER